MPKRARRPRRTAAEAQTFGRYSEQNAATLTAAAELRGCECEPYKDWYTIPRWNYQGYLVTKGEKGIRIGTMAEVKNPKEGESPTRWVTTVVFCRCQVHPMPPPKGGQRGK